MDRVLKLLCSIPVCTRDSRIAGSVIMKIHSGELQERMLTHVNLQSTLMMNAAVRSESASHPLRPQCSQTPALRTSEFT
jgi:hypothetical protein